jgi:uncharacterized protein DUF6496
MASGQTIEEDTMPEKRTLERARQAKRKGRRPTTQAGEFVREEIHHVREGKHGARSAKQAIAIGLSKARRAGVKLGPPPGGRAKATSSRADRRIRRKPSRTRARSAVRALKGEGRHAATPRALARQARQAARRRGPAARKAAARKAVATKGPAARKAAARKAAESRRRAAAPAAEASRVD